MKFFKIFTVMALSVFATVAATAQSPIAIVDAERVERESAAYQDFNLQTAEVQGSIEQLRAYIRQGGAGEQALRDLEQRKSIIGNDKYEEERQLLTQRFATARQNLQVLSNIFDAMLREAQVQIERARKPVITKLLDQQNVKVILYKQQLLGYAAGLDVTTEFIEMLNAELPSVEIKTQIPRAQAPAESNEDTGDN